MTSVIEDAIRENHVLLNRGERELVDQLVREYRASWVTIEMEIRTIVQQIADAKARGEFEITEAWVRRQAWFIQLQQSIDTELNRWERVMGDTIERGQRHAISIARTSIQPLLDIVPGSVFRAFVPRTALELFVSAIQPNSPLAAVLAKYGTITGDTIATGIVRGITEGHGSINTARRITRRLQVDTEGAPISEARVGTIVRTEMHRAYRGAMRTQMEPLEREGIITGYKRVCARDDRVCAACLALDGTETEHYPTAFHPNCRCFGVAVISEAYIPARPSRRESNQDWFDRQSEDVKRKILGGQDAYDAYLDGATLHDFVGYRHSSTWGPSTRVRSAREVRERRGRVQP